MTNHEISNAPLLTHILSSHPPAFALIYRPASTSGDRVDIFTGTIEHLQGLSELSRFHCAEASHGSTHKVLTIIPYRQITERGFECIDDKQPLIALKIENTDTRTKHHILKTIPDTDFTLSDEHYDVDDDTYAKTALKIIKEEIGMGAGSNFVLKRSFMASIADFTVRKGLTLFRRLLQQEVGTYWTFIVYTGDRIFVGATPERHITMENNTVTMNPISGTHRYPASGPNVEGILDFLADHKEAEELYMVVDEELKMMGSVCTDGGTLQGPYLKPMTHLAHTEYFIRGHSKLPLWEILQKTLFAPTITGSPLENACRVIKKYEPQGRAYYSGIIALLSQDKDGDDSMDSSILIRTADINMQGRVQVSAGATLVRNSNPYSEAIETRTKASALIYALQGITAEATNKSLHDYQKLSTHPSILSALKKRNEYLSVFWQTSTHKRARPKKHFKGLKALVIDAEDMFTSMICHQLTSLGFSVSVTNARHSITYLDHDVFVLGPGPGDPRDRHDPRINNLHTIVNTLIDKQHPFLAICLSHQILCTHLGLEIIRKKIPNQGTQKEINLFASQTKAGFYNTFTAMTYRSKIHLAAGLNLQLSRDINTGEIHALRAPFFSSFQFHPESILTQHGTQILSKALCRILK